jgi:hypothetical protein
MEESTSRLTSQDLEREGGELLPDKEVLSVLDLFVNIDIALDMAAPVDLAVAANANIAAPIDAAATANVLTIGSTAGALAEQTGSITQYISGEAVATAPQTATIDQSNDVIDDGSGGSTAEVVVVEDPVADGGAVVGTSDGAITPASETGGTLNGLLEGPLLNVHINAAIDADLAAPVAGAVAVNANVAAPVDAAVAANILTINSESTAIAQQSITIEQTLDGVTASATAEQQADITQ